ncbi:MAG: hypothetical protein HZR80_15670 [Candidatus Heimdallarchaeota archaeon]
MKVNENQTFFIAGKNTKYFNEIENEYQQQESIVRNFIKNQQRPANDLWVAASVQAIGKIAKSVENNDYSKTRKLIVKFISQLLVWVDIFNHDDFNEVTTKTKQIYHPSFNTILVKLIGELSREVLRNDNETIQQKLAIFRSFCEQWIDRIANPDMKQIDIKDLSHEIEEQYWHTEAEKHDGLDVLFSELEEEI